jgi:hypothetical protein
LDVFPDYYTKVKVFPHSNFQLGDSGIAEHFAKLMETSWNTGRGKTVMSLYNAIARGEIASLP